jgi:hypothetical protein
MTVQWIVPDLLAEAKGLSPLLSGVGVLAGGALWLTGWRWHRFWVVLLVTVLGGLWGLAQGESGHLQPVLAALLLAAAAGLLALALVRLLAFAVAGWLFLAAAQGFGSTGDGAVLLFLTGGLLGLVLFRLWLMALTSLAGGWLCCHAGLCLLDSLGWLNAPRWAEQYHGALSWGCSLAALLGLLLQLYLNRPAAGTPATAAAATTSAGPPRPAWYARFRKAG